MPSIVRLWMQQQLIAFHVKAGGIPESPLFADVSLQAQ